MIRTFDTFSTAKESLMRRRIVGAVLMVLSVSLAACRKKPVAIDPVPVKPSTVAGIDDEAARRLREREQEVRDSLARVQANQVSLAGTADAAALRAALEAPILFEYDAADMTEAGRAVLDAKLPILRTNTVVRIRVSGHTDARGSDEYNLALGLRRAASTRKYLADRGIAAARIDVVSFGEERPVTSGEDDAAFMKNRRAEFEILSGGESLRVPPK